MGEIVFETISSYEPKINELAANITLFPFLIYVLGGVIMAAFLFTRRKDIMLWFPARKPGK